MNKQTIHSNPLAQDFSLFSLLHFAFPTMVMMIFMGLYTVVDTIFVARFINTNALSAINIVCPIINIIVGIGTMIATGGSAIVAREMGSGDTKKANQDFTLMIGFGIFIAILIMMFGNLFLDEIIWTLGASKTLFPYCKDYLSIILLFTPASILQVLFQNLIVTAGKPTLGMVLSLGAGILNIILDYIFIVFLNMGIMGSALGTGIGYVIPSIIGILFFMSKKGSLSFDKPIIDLPIIIESCINGSSEMISQISTAVTTFFFNLTMMKLLGENGVGAITIIIYIQFLLTAFYIGFTIGVAPIISFNYGAHHTDHLKTVYKISLYFIVLSSLSIFIFIAIFTNSLVSLFTMEGTELFTLALTGLKIFKYSFLFSGINIFASASFTALSNGKISATISFLRTFGFIMILLFILPTILDINGVWLAIPIAELLTFFVACFFIIKYKEKYEYL